MPTYEVSNGRGKKIARVFADNYVDAVKPFVCKLNLDPRLCRSGNAQGEGSHFDEFHSWLRELNRL
jgi:hypothetical protein